RSSDLDNIKQLSQRIPIRCHLGRFGPEDTQNYILYRLQVSGRTQATFTAEAFSLIHGRSGGIPRRINNICDMCLLVGSSKQAGIIGEEIVKEVAEDLES
ncbi:MAG: hypothetical protein PHE18_06155, partial [Candidatus Omnitrophica bacterium]|nr:hypothetical protein [Candidatus Omnitrophota bacterium]